MFDSVGEKLKLFASVVRWAGKFISIIIAAQVLEVGLHSDDHHDGYISIISVLVIIFGGSLLSWFITCFAYGFGEIIDNTLEIRRNTSNILEIMKSTLTEDTIQASSNEEKSIGEMMEEANEADLNKLINIIEKK